MVLPAVGHLEYLPNHLVLDPDTLERSLEEYIDEDPYPIPLTHEREGHSGPRHFDYWLSGLRDYLSIKQHCGPLESPILELGSATGRTLRHFMCHEKDLQLYAADINPQHIAWLHTHMPLITAVQNQTAPPLPFDDESMALVYAMSVFTHIADHEIKWLAEMRRVLKPGHMAYFTVITDYTWEHMDRRWGIYEDLIRARPKSDAVVVEPDMFDKPMPASKVVLQYGAKTDGYGVVVFHKTDYIREVWGKAFEIVEIIREGYHYQDVVVLRR